MIDPAPRYRQLLTPPPNLVADRLELDGRSTILPIVAVALTREGDVHLLAASVDGFCHEVDFCSQGGMVRERRPGEQLGEAEGSEQ